MFHSSRQQLRDRVQALQARTTPSLAEKFRNAFSRKSTAAPHTEALADKTRDIDDINVNINIDLDEDGKTTGSTRKAISTHKREAIRRKAKQLVRKSSNTTTNAVKRKIVAKRKPKASKKAQDCECKPKSRRRKRGSSNIGKEAFATTKRRYGLRDEDMLQTQRQDAPLTHEEEMQLMDCLYDNDSEGLADREPTDAQAERINMLNKRFLDLEDILRQKYRASYSPRAVRNYVVRKYVGQTEKIETWGDTLLKYRPISIGGKTLERVFKARHGVAWDDFANSNSTMTEIRRLLEKNAWTSVQAEMTKAEAKALRQRMKEEREAAKAAKAAKAKATTQLKTAKKEADKKEEQAQEQAQKAKKAEQQAKTAKAKAKAKPTPTNKAAAKATEKKANMEEKKAEVLEKQAEKAEEKVEKVEAKVEAAETKVQKAEEMSEIDKALLALAKKYS